MIGVYDFGPGVEGCADCWDGRCTMNCSPRRGNVATITSTKRKLIAKEMRDHEGTVTREQMQKLASRHNEPMQAIRDFLSNNGFFCEQLRDETPKPKEERVKVVDLPPRCPLNDHEVAMIRSCKLYREMGEGDWVFVKRSHFENERKAINKLLDYFT